MSNVWIDDQRFKKLFDEYEHTAFRLEPRDRYNVPHDMELLADYLAGKPLDLVSMDSWTSGVRTAASQGKRMSRVRVVSEPLTDYIKCSLIVAKTNNAAGEDIRYLPRDHAEKLGLPDTDWWLFDSVRAAILHFDDDDRPTGEYDLTEDLGFIVQCNHWRDVAWHHAVTREEFAAKHGIE